MIIYIQEIREFYKYMAQEYYKCNFDILYLIRNYDDDTIIQNIHFCFLEC